MGEGDRGAGSLHFFVPGPRVRGGCGRSGNGSHAPPGEAGRKPVPFIFCVRPRERGGCDAAEAESETEAKPHQEERRKGRTARAKARARRAPGGEGRDRSRSGVRNGSEVLSGGAARGRTARAKARARREFPGSPILSDSRGTLLYRCIAGRTTCSTCRHSSRRAPSGCGAVPRPAGP